MTPSDGAHSDVLLAILAMALPTYAMRAGGFWLMGHVPLTARLRRMLEALPGSVLIATVLPIAMREGVVGLLAIAASILVMYLRRNDLIAVIAGLAVVIGARAAGL